jgi:hypothetical protein
MIAGYRCRRFRILVLGPERQADEREARKEWWLESGAESRSNPDTL